MDGTKAKEVENTGFKIWYTRKEQSSNSVDILITIVFRIEQSLLEDKRTGSSCSNLLLEI
jgi:hypothetical protein